MGRDKNGQFIFFFLFGGVAEQAAHQWQAPEKRHRRAHLGFTFANEAAQAKGFTILQHHHRLQVPRTDVAGAISGASPRRLDFRRDLQRNAALLRHRRREFQGDAVVKRTVIRNGVTIGRHLAHQVVNRIRHVEFRLVAVERCQSRPRKYLGMIVFF